VQMLSLSISGEDDYEAMQAISQNLIKGILSDPKAGIATLEKASMPPITMGFKVSDADQREMISQTIGGGLVSLIDAQLAGISIKGQALVELADPDTREGMKEAFGSAAEVDRFLKVISKKDLHLATGVKGDYIFIYLGASLDDLKFAEKPADSLLASPGLDFLKNYTDKDIRVFFFGEEEAMDQLSGDSEALASMARGIKSGLSETDVFGDTRDVQALLEHVASVEKDLLGMIDYSRSGMVGFLEDGFKLETHGGGTLAYLNTEDTHTFTSLETMDDLLYYGNSRTNPEFTSKLLDMLDSLGQASYLMMDRVAGMEVDDRDFREFSQGFKMFSEVGASELSVIWEALSMDWSEGTGDEGALIIDTKGTLPTVPNIPASIIKEGRIPRIAYVTPVTNRAKMSSAWAKIEKSVEKILDNVSEVSGTPIPMQEINENTKEGMSYFNTGIHCRAGSEACGCCNWCFA